MTMDVAIDWGADKAWLYDLGWGLLLLGVARPLLTYLARRFRRRHAQALHPVWSSTEAALRGPVLVILWVLGGYFVCKGVAGYFFGPDWVAPVRPYRDTLVLILGAWGLIRWKNELCLALAERRGSDREAVQLLGKFGGALILLLTLMWVLQTLGVDIAPLIAFGGIGAATLGFAAKDMFANFFGGLMLYITKPFRIGDLVYLPEKGVEGYIEEIGWYHSALRDREKRAVYLPNSVFATIQVINGSRRSHRRFLEKIELRYADLPHLAQLTHDVKDYLIGHPKVDSHLPILVNLAEFLPSSVRIDLEAYCFATKWEEFIPLRGELLAAVAEIVSRHGAQMPLPTSHVHLHTASPSSEFPQ